MIKKLVWICALFLSGCAVGGFEEERKLSLNVKNSSDDAIKVIEFWSSTFKSRFHPKGFIRLGKESANGFSILGLRFPTDGTLRWVYKGVEYTKAIDTAPYGHPSSLALNVLVTGDQLYTCKRQLDCVCTSPTDPSYHKPPAKPEYKNCPVHGPY